MQYNAIPCNTMQYHAIPCNTMQYHAMPCNTMQYNEMPCNTMQYHASLITADGAYHCPVGSIMAIFGTYNWWVFSMVLRLEWFDYFLFSWLGRVKSGQDLPRFIKETPILKKNQFFPLFFLPLQFFLHGMVWIGRGRLQLLVPNWPCGGSGQPGPSKCQWSTNNRPQSTPHTFDRLGNKNRDLFGSTSHLCLFQDYYWWF